MKRLPPLNRGLDSMREHRSIGTWYVLAASWCSVALAIILIVTWPLSYLSFQGNDNAFTFGKSIWNSFDDTFSIVTASFDGFVVSFQAPRTTWPDCLIYFQSGNITFNINVSLPLQSKIEWVWGPFALLVLRQTTPGVPGSIFFDAPFWFLVLVLLLWPFCAYLVIHVHIKKTRKQGKCPFCSYDLTGNTSGTCPECGIQCIPD